MKICLSGVSNSGKSTFFAMLRKNKMYKNYIEEQIRVVLDNEYSTTKQGIELQQAIYDQQSKIQDYLRDFVTDRGFIDVAAYGIYYNSLSYDSSLTRICMRRTKEYDTVLLFTKSYPFVNDGFRVKEDTDKLNAIFTKLISKYNCDNVVKFDCSFPKVWI